MRDTKEIDVGTVFVAETPFCAYDFPVRNCVFSLENVCFLMRNRLLWGVEHPFPNIG